MFCGTVCENHSFLPQVHCELVLLVFYNFIILSLSARRSIPSKIFLNISIFKYILCNFIDVVILSFTDVLNWKIENSMSRHWLKLFLLFSSKYLNISLLLSPFFSTSILIFVPQRSLMTFLWSSPKFFIFLHSKIFVISAFFLKTLQDCNTSVSLISYSLTSFSCFYLFFFVLVSKYVSNEFFFSLSLYSIYWETKLFQYWRLNPGLHALPLRYISSPFYFVLLRLGLTKMLWVTLLLNAWDIPCLLSWFLSMFVGTVVCNTLPDPVDMWQRVYLNAYKAA